MDPLATLAFAALVVACCGHADRLGQLLGVLDRPDGLRKLHARPTPLIGGIALVLPLSWVAVSEGLRWPPAAEVLFALAAAGLAFMVLGWLDDRRHTAPGLRLAVSAAFCGALLALAPGLRLTALDFGWVTLPLGLLALPFTVLCLVGLQNALNMADGLDGLVIGLGLFWTACLLLYAPPHLQVYLTFLLLGLLLLLPFNLIGWLFLGDAGSYPLGVVFGLLMLDVYQAAAGALPMTTVILWLLVPVVDCLRVMTERMRAGRSPLAADRQHLHHLLARRWSPRAALAAYLALAVLPGLAAAFRPALTGEMLLLAGAGYYALVWTLRHAAPAAALGPAVEVTGAAGAATMYERGEG